MGYELTLRKAGADVLAFQKFGSYQGTWLAFVIYNGEKGIVQGCYGSCSGCDSYQATFDYDSEPAIEDGVFYKSGRCWDEDDVCTEKEYRMALVNYQQKLANFGAEYLNTGLYGKTHYEQRLEQLKAKEDQDDWFDNEEKEYVEWAINQAW